MCEEYILRRPLFGMEVPLRHGVLVIPFEKISCLVPLRTSMLREPDHRTLRTHHSLLNGRGTVTRPTRMVSILLGWKWIVQGGTGIWPTPS